MLAKKVRGTPTSAKPRRWSASLGLLGGLGCGHPSLPHLRNSLLPPKADGPHYLTGNRGLKWSMPRLRHHILTPDVAPTPGHSAQRLRFFLPRSRRAVTHISPLRSGLHRLEYARSSSRVSVSEDLLYIALSLLFAIATLLRLGLHDFQCVEYRGMRQSLTPTLRISIQIRTLIRSSSECIDSKRFSCCCRSPHCDKVLLL